MPSGVISTLQQVGAALGVAAVGILFGAIVADETASGGPGVYASAFVNAMLYNLVAAVLITMLLVGLARRTSATPMQRDPKAPSDREQ